MQTQKVFYAPGPQHNDPRCRWARLPDSPCPVFAPPYSVFRLQTCSTRWDTALPSTCHTTQPAQSKFNTGYILPLYKFSQTTDCCPPPRVSKRIRPLIPDLAITKPFVPRNGKVWHQSVKMTLINVTCVFDLSVSLINCHSVKHIFQPFMLKLNYSYSRLCVNNSECYRYLI